MGVAGVAGPTGAIGREHVIRAGRRQFLRAERIDVVGIAEELGIARATVYRWFGGRDRVIGEVLWSLAEQTLDDALAARPARDGAAGLIDACLAGMTAIAGHPAMRHFLGADPERALSLLTGRGSAVADGCERWVRDGLEQRSPASLTAAVPADELAYAVRRLLEAYVYADVIAGREVDLERARPILHRLLEGP